MGLADKEYDLGDANDRHYYLYVSGRWGRQKGIDEVLRLAELNPYDEFRAYGSADVLTHAHAHARAMRVLFADSS
jgi:hypothetical protein